MSPKKLSTSEQIKECGKWFNINNYKKLESLTLRELAVEILARHVIFEFSHKDGSYIEPMLNGKPIISKNDVLAPLFHTKEIDVLSTSHVHPVGVGYLMDMVSLINNKVLVDEFDYYDDDIRKGFLCESLAKRSREFEGKMLFEISLSESTDEEIIDSLGYLLPKLRNKVGIYKRQKPLNTGASLIKRIVEYRIIPLVDLLCWGQIYDINIGNTALSRLLYPVGSLVIRGEDQIKATDRPLAEDIISGVVTKKIEALISKSQHSGDTIVKDFLKK